jgi:hypothetical protein
MPNVQCYLTHDEMKKFRLRAKALGFSTETSFLKYIISQEIKKPLDKLK